MHYSSKITFIAILIIVSACIAFSQDGPGTDVAAMSGIATANNFAGWSGQPTLNQMISDIERGYAGTEASYASIEGSPFIHKDYLPSTLILNNGTEIVDEYELNYDCYQGRMVAKDRTGERFLLDPIYFQKVILTDNDQQFVYKKTDPNQPKFYQVLSEKNDLVVYQNCKTSISEGITNGIANKPRKFYSKMTYYVVDNSNDTKPRKIKKKEISKYK